MLWNDIYCFGIFEDKLTKTFNLTDARSLVICMNQLGTDIDADNAKACIEHVFLKFSSGSEIGSNTLIVRVGRATDMRNHRD